MRETVLNDPKHRFFAVTRKIAYLEVAGTFGGGGVSWGRKSNFTKMSPLLANVGQGRGSNVLEASRFN